MKSLTALVLAAAVLSGAVWAHEDDSRAKKATATKISGEVHAFGREGDPKKALRTITIDMNDQMRFSPAEIAVTQGETVRFVVANKGQVLHEMVIGTEKELMAHAEMMKKHPGMEHEAPYMAHVKAGGKEQITWQFTKAGTFAFACLIPGHYEAGMKGRIVVAAKQ